MTVAIVTNVLRAVLSFCVKYALLYGMADSRVISHLKELLYHKSYLTSTDLISSELSVL